MPQLIEVKIPDIGDFENVPVIDILVSSGDRVEKETPLLTLESDKATLDIPAPEAGVVGAIHVGIGDTVSEGTPILSLQVGEKADTEDPAAVGKTAAAPKTTAAPASGPETDLLVLGSGPGGYTAAFRAADLGLDVVLVERHKQLGGVCLNVGCIPSKALLHAAAVIRESAAAEKMGVTFGRPEIDLARLRRWKERVVRQLTGGLAGLAKKRKVRVVRGEGRFTSSHTLSVTGAEGTTTLSFRQAIIAAGSESIRIPGFPHDDPRVIDSSGALALEEVPPRLLIVGGGIIGLEMATVYAALGSKVSIVEMMDVLIPGADPDLVRPLQRHLSQQCENIWLSTRVTAVEARKEELLARFDGRKAPGEAVFDKILVAVGRTPNGNRIGAEAAGVEVDERGFIAVDAQQRTNVPHLFAIGDIVGQPMLAHKAVHEGKVAAEVAAGLKSGFDARVIPSVAYTDPEVAWVGVTEAEAKERGVDYGKGAFPWAASGRALSLGRSEGMTKLLFDNGTKRLIGAGIVGANAGDLIAEAALAIEMGADAADLALTIHPHPTLSETLGFAAEAFEGTITDLYLPKQGNV